MSASKHSTPWMYARGLPLLLFVALLGATGCEEELLTGDAGLDTGDAGLDTGDTGLDAHDAAAPAPDGDVDAGSDAAPAPGPDAGPSPDAAPGAEPDAGGAASDDFAVGTLRIELQTEPGRVLPVQLWYPAVTSAREAVQRGRPLPEIEPPGARRDALAKLIEAETEGCASRMFHAAEAAEPLPRAEPYPLLVFSHCMDCVRYAVASVAEHLASRGFVVAAPDHETGTLYDNLAETSVGLAVEFLDQRVIDVTRILDLLLDPSTSAVPSGLRGQLSAESIGVFGHSLGSATAGLVAQQDARVKALSLLAAPIGLPGVPFLDQLVVDVASMTKPALFVLASEDNSITELGNEVIRQDFAEYPVESWLLTLPDAGHYSFTDICNLIPLYEPGCREGTRQTELFDTPFTYLDIGVARDATKRAIAAFFEKTLLNRGAGPETLSLSAGISVDHHARP